MATSRSTDSRACAGGLAGQPQHEVEAHVVEAGGARQDHGLGRPVGSVQAAEPGELLGAEGLGPEAQAVGPGGAVAGEAGRGDALRIALEGDLRRRRRPRKLSRHAARIALELGRRQQRGRAAAKVDGLDRDRRRRWRRMSVTSAATYCALTASSSRPRVKLQYRADRLAERDVDVQAGHGPVPANQRDPPLPPAQFTSAAPRPRSDARAIPRALSGKPPRRRF